MLVPPIIEVLFVIIEVLRSHWCLKLIDVMQLSSCGEENSINPWIYNGIQIRTIHI